MELTFAAPAILLSSIALLNLAYTNRFMGLASLVRRLNSEYKASSADYLLAEIKNLRARIHILRDAQALGATSLLMAVICIFTIFLSCQLCAKIFFGLALLVAMVSLISSIREIYLSVHSLELELQESIPDLK